MYHQYQPPSAGYIRRKITPILRKHHVKRAGIFPTFASEESVKHSKIGLIVEFDTEATMFDLVEIKQNVERILERYIDITTYDGILERFRDHVEKYHTTIL